MAAGQQNKVAFIIQARMKSTRLPGKTLLPLPLNADTTILGAIIEELKKSGFEHKIIVATSVNPADIALATYCAEHQISCYRGDEEDVLSRFWAVCEEDQFQTVVRLTADNPFLDIGILDEAIAFHLKNANDYTKTENLPIGMNLEIVDQQQLTGLKDQVLSLDDREHVTLFIRNNNFYKKGVFQPVVEEALKDLRLTVDYPADYTLAATLMMLYRDQKALTVIAFITWVLKTYPWIFESNRTNYQKRQYADLKDEMPDAVAILERYELRNTLKILKDLES